MKAKYFRTKTGRVKNAQACGVSEIKAAGALPAKKLNIKNESKVFVGMVTVKSHYCFVV